MPTWKKTLREAFGVIAAAMVLAVAAFLLRPTLRPMVNGRASISSPAYESGITIPMVTLEEARDYFNADKVLFADARPDRAYRKGHIRGAMHLDPNEFDSWSESFFSQFAPDTLIITYCDGAQCPLSSELAEKLVWLGYEKIFIFKDGWHLWQTAHLPTEQVAD